ncbi:MAG: ATP-binding cassette, subfamily B, bacterial, partial [bacterium]
MTPEAHPEEEITGKAFDRRLMNRLLAYLAPHRGWVILATIILLLTSALELVGPWLTQMAIDETIPARDDARLLFLTLAFFGALAGALLFTWFQTWIMQRVGQLVMYEMRRKIFRHQMGMSSAWFDRNPVGRMLTRLTTDVDVLNEMLTSGVVALFGDLVTLFGILGIMFWLDWRLTLATLVVMPLLVILTAWFRRGVRETYRMVRTRIARINTFLQENITGMSVVQIFGREAHRNRHFDRLNADHLDAHIRSIFYYAVFYPLVELISAIALALVLWYGGIRLLGAGTDAAPLTLGVLVAFIQYVRRFYRPIMDLSEKYNILQAAMA